MFGCRFGASQHSTVNIGVDRSQLIALCNQTTADLQRAKCTNIDCESATISRLDSTGDAGQISSLSVGSDGLSAMINCDATDGALKFAKCSNIACDSVAIVTVDSTTILENSLRWRVLTSR